LIYLAAVGRRQSTDALRLLIDLLQTDYGGRVNVLIYLTAVGRRQSTNALRLLIDLLQTDYNGRVKVINRSNCRQTNSDGAINKSNCRRTLTRLLIDLILDKRRRAINRPYVRRTRYSTIFRSGGGGRDFFDVGEWRSS